MDVHRAPVESRHKGTTKIAHTQIKNTPKVVFSNLSHFLFSFISGVCQTPLFVSFFAFQADIIHRSSSLSSITGESDSPLSTAFHPLL
ncbi:MAG: hypothetical protein IJR09_01320 [Paludibacteraceae bacterium]|nr:hypothetical protein [Paludibacteraceae bacterium]MBR0064778.1 hypothetical protein [Paludibacteraceae bacterium]